MTEFAETPGSTIVAWHASLQRLDRLMPFSHIGSRAAVMARGGALRGPWFLHEIKLRIGSAWEVGDCVGASHPVRGLVERLETDLELDFELVDELLMAARSDEARGIPASLAGGEAVAKVLRDLGIDTLRYVNAIEDPGSVSWIVLDPEAARIVSSTRQPAPSEPSDEPTGMRP